MGVGVEAALRIPPALAETHRLRPVVCSGTPKDEPSLLNFPQGERLLFSIRMLTIDLGELEAIGSHVICLQPLFIIFTLNLLGFFLLEPLSLLSLLLSKKLTKVQ